ncbi:MAG TPA: phosphopantothenate/pantothenate synthetase [Thermoplasmatales archaeon]|nr:phosphopantothenate/pantothenate synthetase [Thermoplasmatales archaeon]
MTIPKSHPRYRSLITREKLAEGFKEGLVHTTGLIAHGRGEAFDYLIGEQTLDIADRSARAAAAALLIAKSPVISINGNTVALVGRECVSLSKSIPAKLEVNLFHRSEERVKRIAERLKAFGADRVYGENADARIDGLEHDRALCSREGIYSADVVLVPLEDGDRCQALRNMGKTVIAIDLNPLSRTAQSASITIVDNVIRAIPNIERWVKILRSRNSEDLKKIVDSWNNKQMLKEVLDFISKRLNSI